MKTVLIVVPPLVLQHDTEETSFSRPDIESYRLVTPVEPVSVATDLQLRGFAVSFLDLGIYRHERFEKLAFRLKTIRPDAVVMVQSILTFATAQDWNGKYVFDLARQENPSVVTILTGGHATNYPGEAVKAGICDYSIRGEVDFAVGQLLEALRDGGDLSGIPGLSYRRGDEISTTSSYGSVDIAAIPIPDYAVLDQEHRDRYAAVLEFGKIRYPEKSARYRDIMTSRGCPLRCAFCSVAPLRGEKQRYRRKPMERVIREIESALDEGVEEIHFFDDLFAETESQVLDFTNALVKHNLKFHWFVAQGMPLWPLTPTSLAAMKETGMYRLICPFESGNDRVLKRIIGKKYSTVDHHHRVVEWASRLGIELIGMFVVGMPGEMRAEILDTLNFAEHHPQLDYSVFSIATPMVGTRLMKQVMNRQEGFDQEAINRVIKRTVALYHTEEFQPYELGVIRAFDWDRINFGTEERCRKYAQMVGLTLQQLDELRDHAKETFFSFFPNYHGPFSFHELIHCPRLYREMEPRIA
ncbi:MAG: radical SAM protein [Nitrospirae bacterium]|nr:MAG: radical SAM protein [Nitrospirota bacterium]